MLMYCAKMIYGFRRVRSANHWFAKRTLQEVRTANPTEEKQALHRPEIEEFDHVLIEYLLRLRVGEGKAHLVDHLGAHADPFAPAGGAGFFLDFFAQRVAEGGLGEPRADAAAAVAEDFALADWSFGFGFFQFGDGGAGILEHFDHVVAGHHVAALVGE